jgi:hypothetical protein
MPANLHYLVNEVQHPPTWKFFKTVQELGLQAETAEGVVEVSSKRPWYRAANLRPMTFGFCLVGGSGGLDK